MRHPFGSWFDDRAGNRRVRQKLGSGLAIAKRNMDELRCAVGWQIHITASYLPRAESTRRSDRRIESAPAIRALEVEMKSAKAHRYHGEPP